MITKRRALALVVAVALAFWLVELARMTRSRTRTLVWAHAHAEHTDTCTQASVRARTLIPRARAHAGTELYSSFDAQLRRSVGDALSTAGVRTRIRALIRMHPHTSASFLRTGVRMQARDSNPELLQSIAGRLDVIQSTIGWYIGQPEGEGTLNGRAPKGQPQGLFDSEVLVSFGMKG